MIISGFPGIGKSSVSGAYNNAVDLESSMFFVDGVRESGWEKVYVNIAEDLSRQGFCVFVSSHEVVRDELKSRGTKFHSIYPSADLRDEWLGKLSLRLLNIQTNKNANALKYMAEHYFDCVKDMSLDPNPIEITTMDYSLMEMIKKLRDDE